MKKIDITAGILLALLICTAAQAKLPKTYKEFKERYQTEGRTIEGAVKLYFEGVFAFMNEETRKEGGKMLRYAMYSDRPIERSTYYATFVERMKDPDYNYAFRSYAEGATPENNYSMSPDNFEIMYAGKPVKDPGGYYRVPVYGTLSTTPRLMSKSKSLNLFRLNVRTLMMRILTKMKKTSRKKQRLQKLLNLIRL